MKVSLLRKYMFISMIDFKKGYSILKHMIGGFELF